jgi:penicillin-binding protein 1A
MLRYLVKALIILAVLGVVSLVVISAIIIPTLPNIEELKDVQMQIPLRVYSHDGSLISEFGEKRRVPVKIENVPEKMKQAFIAAEDDRFYIHPGVDWRGIMRAVVNLIKTGEKSVGGSTITMQIPRNFILISRERTYLRKIKEIFLAFKIEQELTKDEILELYFNVIFLGHRSYGVGAAAQVYYGTTVDKLSLAQIAMIAGLPQAPSTTNPVTNKERARNRRSYVLARMLEEGYISQSEYNSANEAPVTAYIHSPTIDLEAPYVAEMVRREMINRYGDYATTMGYRVYTTIRDKNQIAANHALRSAVLEYDLRHGYRGPESHIEFEGGALQQQHLDILDSFPVIANLYPALVTGVRDQSISVYLSGIGYIDIEWDNISWARKYINENIRGKQPELASEIVSTGDVIRIKEDDLGQWVLSQLPKVEGAIVSIDPSDGSTLALTGGFDFYRSNFNRVIQARRQPGSGFKPFIYSAALEEGFTAASIINDAPLVKEFPGIEDAWRPENYSGKYFGPTRLREALIASRNIISIRLLDAIGIDKAMEHFVKFGFDIEKLPHSLSLALGSGDLSPWEMASAYTVFANGGFLVEPYYIDKITEDNGELIFQAEPLMVCGGCIEEEKHHTDLTINNNAIAANSNDIPQISDPLQNPGEQEEIHHKESHYAPRTVDADNIWIMNSITRDVIRRGTGTRALILNRRDIGGKTGTTNDQKDAWFFGFNPSIVTVSWVGFDDFRELGRIEVGGRAALPMWIDYMRVVLADIPENPIVQPPGLITARIDPDTGKLASADNPNAIFEVFRAGNAPTEVEETSASDPFANQVVEPDTPIQLF